MITSWTIVSKHRSQLMLLSILWVMTFHFTPPIHTLTLLHDFQSIGCGGVDVFMFLSGFGLCCSYYNRDSISPFIFYKRRFLKIIPTYFVCIIVFGIIRSVSLTDLLWHLSCIGFWIGKPTYDWYVPSILVLYLAFPFFVRLSKKFGIRSVAVLASIIGLIPTSLFIYLGKGTWILFTARIPLFFMGCYAGWMLEQRKEIRYSWLMIALSVCAFIVEMVFASKYDYEPMHRLGLYYIPQMLIVPGGCLVVAELLDKVPSWILAPMKLLGSMTLEIYLVHMSMRFIYPESKYVLSILLAIALHYFVQYSMKYIQVKTNRNRN